MSPWTIIGWLILAVIGAFVLVYVVRFFACMVSDTVRMERGAADARAARKERIRRFRELEFRAGKVTPPMTVREWLRTGFRPEPTEEEMFRAFREAELNAEAWGQSPSERRAGKPLDPNA